MELRKGLFRAAAAGIVLFACQGALAQWATNVRWSELGPAVSRKNVTVVLSDGGRIYGKVLGVAADGLSMQVRGTPDAGSDPKGRFLVPRASVSMLELKKKRFGFRKVLTGVGIGLGTALVIAAVTFGKTAADVAPREGEDPKVSERRVKKYLIGIGAFSVAVGTGFSIQAARKTSGGGTTIRIIRVVHEEQ